MNAVSASCFAKYDGRWAQGMRASTQVAWQQHYYVGLTQPLHAAAWLMAGQVTAGSRYSARSYDLYDAAIRITMSTPQQFDAGPPSNLEGHSCLVHPIHVLYPSTTSYGTRGCDISIPV